MSQPIWSQNLETPGIGYANKVTQGNYTWWHGQSDNLLENPNGRDGLKGWNLFYNAAEGWAVDARGGFKTSYFWNKKKRWVYLRERNKVPVPSKNEFEEAVRNGLDLTLTASEEYSRTYCTEGRDSLQRPRYEEYYLTVRLYTEYVKLIEEKTVGPVRLSGPCDWNDDWKKAELSFKIPQGSQVFYVEFEHGGVGAEPWGGRYGPKMRNAQVSWRVQPRAIESKIKIGETDFPYTAIGDKAVSLGDVLVGSIHYVDVDPKFVPFQPVKEKSFTELFPEPVFNRKCRQIFVVAKSPSNPEKDLEYPDYVKWRVNANDEGKPLPKNKIYVPLQYNRSQNTFTAEIDPNLDIYDKDGYLLRRSTDKVTINEERDGYLHTAQLVEVDDMVTPLLEAPARLACTPRVESSQVTGSSSIPLFPFTTPGIGRKWPNANILYGINKGITQEYSTKIKTAINMLNESEINIKFTEKKPGTCWLPLNGIDDLTHIEFLDSPFSYSSSPIGQIPFLHPILIDQKTATLGTVVHEIGHALGLTHEQQRNHRDEFIGINEGNLNKKEGFAAYINLNFLSPVFFLFSSRYFDIKYDYNSIMHYDACSYANNNSECRDENAKAVWDFATASPTHAHSNYENNYKPKLVMYPKISPELNLGFVRSATVNNRAIGIGRVISDDVPTAGLSDIDKIRLRTIYENNQQHCKAGEFDFGVGYVCDALELFYDHILRKLEIKLPEDTCVKKELAVCAGERYACQLLPVQCSISTWTLRCERADCSIKSEDVCRDRARGVCTSENNTISYRGLHETCNIVRKNLCTSNPFCNL